MLTLTQTQLGSRTTWSLADISISDNSYVALLVIGFMGSFGAALACIQRSERHDDEHSQKRGAGRSWMGIAPVDSDEPKHLGDGEDEAQGEEPEGRGSDSEGEDELVARISKLSKAKRKEMLKALAGP